MPTSSKRKLYLDEVEKLINVIKEFEPLDAEDEEAIEYLLMLTEEISRERYLEPRRLNFKKPRLSDVLVEYSERQFKQEVRMSKESFLKIVEAFSAHPIFQNHSRRKQSPVWLQFMVTFKRLGCFGNGSSLGAIGRLHGLSEGGVDKIFNRVITAILSIANDIIKWPDADERTAIKARFQRNHGILGAVGIIDGTPVVFAQRPSIDGEVFWSRKSIYCINLQLVCDDKGYIRWMLSGWPGSVFDNTVFEKSTLCRNPDQHFSHGEYVMADAGYALKLYCISPYKLPLSDIPHHALFNEKFSSKRVTIEHVNGQLKNRWASLKSLPYQIKKKRDFRKLNRHVTACVCLHNLLKSFNDQWPDEYNLNAEDDEYNLNAMAMVAAAVESEDARNLRVVVENYLLQWAHINNRV